MEWRGDGHSLTQYTVIGNCLLSYLFRCTARSGAHGIASKFYPEGVMQEPVADGIGQGGVADVRMDVHRIPDKVQAVMDAMVGDLITNTLEVMKLTEGPGVMLVLERGGGFYFPLKVFERFEMPYIKKMVEAFAKEGYITMMHFDQDWTLNLPYLLDLPRKMCICEVDSKTDIFKAKQILGNHMCIAGDVPAAMPGENCTDLDTLLAASDVSDQHLAAVKEWLQEKKREGGDGDMLR